MRITQPELDDIIYAARQVGMLEAQLALLANPRALRRLLEAVEDAKVADSMVESIRADMAWRRDALNRKCEELQSDLVAVHAAFMKDHIKNVLGHPAESLEDCVALAEICK